LASRAIYLARPLAAEEKKLVPVQPSQKSENPSLAKEWQNKNRESVGIEAKCAFDGLVENFDGFMARARFDMWEKKVVSAAFCCVLENICVYLYTCKSTCAVEECSPRSECKYIYTLTSRFFFKHVRFYCPFFSIIFYYSPIKMLSQPPLLRLLFLLTFRVCFIRTFGPRIFNQSMLVSFSFFSHC